MCLGGCRFRGVPSHPRSLLSHIRQTDAQVLEEMFGDGPAPSLARDLPPERSATELQVRGVRVGHVPRLHVHRGSASPLQGRGRCARDSIRTLAAARIRQNVASNPPIVRLWKRKRVSAKSQAPVTVCCGMLDGCDPMRQTRLRRRLRNSVSGEESK